VHLTVNIGVAVGAVRAGILGRLAVSYEVREIGIAVVNSLQNCRLFTFAGARRASALGRKTGSACKSQQRF
jgi:hypothetical protein